MTIKFAVKNAFSGKYLAEASESDKIFNKKRKYAFHVCDAIYEIALFDTKEEAVQAYAESDSNNLNETGELVEMIVEE